MKLIERKNCPMQRKNGDCLVMGGFCLYVNDEICRGLHNAYNKGVKVEPIKHGRWIKLYHGNYKCSECGEWWGSDYNDEVINDFKYCPNCGAKMFDKDIDVPDKNVVKMDEMEKRKNFVDLGDGFSITANGKDGEENVSKVELDYSQICWSSAKCKYKTKDGNCKLNHCVR